MIAGGANMVVFTTGRGSVFGAKAVPTIKLASNSDMYARMEEDMDINCGAILTGASLEETGRHIFEEIIEVASGKRTKSENACIGDEEFAPWILGPTL
jgi:altronate hydrolase